MIRTLFGMVLVLTLKADLLVQTAPDFRKLLWDGNELEAPALLGNHEINEDLDILIFALEHGYGGRDFIQRDLFNTALQRINFLRSIQAISPHELCIALDDILHEIPDEHLLAQFNREPCSPERRASYQTGRIGKNKNSSQAPWFLQTSDFFGKSVLTIALTRFPPAADKVWGGFLDLLAKNLAKSDATIIDLRGNSGGDDTTARRMAQLFYGRDRWPHPVEGIYVRNQAATHALFANAIMGQLQKLLARGQDVKELREQREDEIILAADLEKKAGAPYLIRSLGTPFRRLSSKDVSYRHPIVILIDRNCGSSGETSVDYFAAHPFLTVMGENSSGTIHFGNVGHFLLPHSQIKIAMATQFRQYYDHRSIERQGLSPDIVVPPGSNAFDHALEHISALP